MKAWITKYALTKGILEVDDAELYSTCDDAICVPSISPLAGFHGDDWHYTLGSAEAKALKMIAAKRKSIAKTLAKLDKLEQKLTKGQGA